MLYNTPVLRRWESVSYASQAGTLPRALLRRGTARTSSLGNAMASRPSARQRPSLPGDSFARIVRIPIVLFLCALPTSAADRDLAERRICLTHCHAAGHCEVAVHHLTASHTRVSFCIGSFASRCMHAMQYSTRMPRSPSTRPFDEPRLVLLTRATDVGDVVQAQLIKNRRSIQMPTQSGRLV